MLTNLAIIITTQNSVRKFWKLTQLLIVEFLIQQLRVALMDLMTSAGVIDAETDQPIRGSASDADQSLAFKQLLHTTDDLAALDKLEEVPITCLHLIIIQTKRNNLSRSLF